MKTNQKNLKKLEEKAKLIFEGHRGILAIDESPSSIEKKFNKYKISNSLITRTRFRETLLKTPDIEKYIGGVILHEETYFQKDSDNKPLVDTLRSKGIYVGVKVDEGLSDFNDTEKYTLGIEELQTKIDKNGFQAGDFAKWRSLFFLEKSAPSEECINKNCEILSEYAKICQDNGIIPIVEPEIYFEGNYDLSKAKTAYKRILSTLFKYLNSKDVFIPAVILKMSFVTPGKAFLSDESDQSIASATNEVICSTVPSGIAAVAFLSGGHDEESAISYLRLVNKDSTRNVMHLSFSYGRTLTDSAMSIWKEDESRNEEAQKAFFKVAKSCSGTRERSF